MGSPIARERVPGEVRLSRACLPLLRVLQVRLGADQVEDVLREVGRGMAPDGPPAGGIEDRMQAAAGYLRSLGGFPEVVPSDAGPAIRCSCCAIGAVVAEHPLACRGVAAMLEAYLGQPVRERCDRSGRPACRFEVAIS